MKTRKMFKTFDFQCECGHIQEAMVEKDDIVYCECCKKRMNKILSAPTIFHKIVPTYPGSQQHKAGYAHKYVNRPAEKTQIGYGGGISGPG